MVDFLELYAVRREGEGDYEGREQVLEVLERLRQYDRTRECIAHEMCREG